MLKLPKSMANESSPLGPLMRGRMDLFEVALAKFKKEEGSFLPEQLESLFWALSDVAALNRPALDAKELAEIFLKK